ncbi:MAG: hypothetical protein HPY70_04995 [Firmicutes bacterium]|nr:hypothetical protein [Bacillota bacterium]
MKFYSCVIIVLALLMVFVISSGVFAAQYPKIEVTPHKVTIQEAGLIEYIGIII